MDAHRYWLPSNFQSGRLAVDGTPRGLRASVHGVAQANRRHERYAREFAKLVSSHRAAPIAFLADSHAMVVPHMFFPTGVSQPSMEGAFGVRARLP